MYDHNVRQILLPKDFILPFEGHLNEDNRWVKLAFIIPWWTIEEKYIKKFKSLKYGQKANSVRCALGALIIQNRLGLTDEETVEQITENPYLQYFIGLSKFQLEKPFDSSLMTRFRKRLNVEVINEINLMIAEEAIKQEAEKAIKKINEAEKNKDDDDNQNPKSGGSGGQDQGEQIQLHENFGKLILDATCAPADVHYPTDLWLLNESREKLEAIIDTLHAAYVGIFKKPRTYREKAHKDYLVLSKQRKPGIKKIRKGIKKQLGYVKRDLNVIGTLIQKGGMDALNMKQLKDLYVIGEIYRQQSLLLNSKNHQIDDRIVNIAQPHVRPIVRGKVNASVEFGAKLSISVVDGFAFMERISFDNFNEGITLQESVERYKERYGYYPEAVLADQIYRNRDNIQYCKSKGIRLSGPKLGRPKADEVKANRKQAYEDSGERNAVEGKFGEGKRTYKLDRIFAKLKETSETVIAMQLLVMNLEKRLRLLLQFLLNYIKSIVFVRNGRFFEQWELVQ